MCREHPVMESTTFIIPRAAKPRAFICIPLEESLADRSTVLASLMDVHGSVELPSGIDVSDVLTWAESVPEQAEDMDWEDLTHTLQVCLR